MNPPHPSKGNLPTNLKRVGLLLTVVGSLIMFWMMGDERLSDDYPAVGVIGCLLLLAGLVVFTAGRALEI